MVISVNLMYIRGKLTQVQGIVKIMALNRNLGWGSKLYKTRSVWEIPSGLF